LLLITCKIINEQLQLRLLFMRYHMLIYVLYKSLQIHESHMANRIMLSKIVFHSIKGLNRSTASF